MEVTTVAYPVRLLVDIPDDEGVHTKTAGAKGEKYVYKYTKYFRNADGHPRNRAKSIGKYDPSSGKMIPNSSYYEIYHLDPSMPEVFVWDYGYSYLVNKVCISCGLLDCLKKAFGGHVTDIIAMAAYMIREGSAMDGLDDWLQRNYFQDLDHLITSQAASRIFASLTPSQMDRFFVEWIKAALGGGAVCYDVTSISSYAREMTSVERGYNRDGDDLAQYNIGMFCDEVSRTPLYYNRYNGSLTDKVNLAYVLANARAVGIKRVKMILDGGFWSEECLVNLQNQCDSFTIGMPASLKESERIITQYGEGIESYVNEIPGHHVYCIPLDVDVHGIHGRVMLYYDPWNHVNLCNELSEHINRLKAELAACKRFPKGKLGRYSPYFILTKHEQGNGFSYTTEAEKIEKMRKAKGYFLIFTNDKELTPMEILDYYRAKDADEKLFSQIKVDMDGRRIRTHNERTTDGKTFIAFIACIIRSYLLTKLSSYLTDHSTSMKKVFNQLSNITVLSSQNGFRFAKALTKTQKLILAAFNADVAILDSLS